MPSTQTLDSSVLVLNRFYMAIRVVSVRRAMHYLFKDSAEVIFVEEDRWGTYDFDSWLELSRMEGMFPIDEETAFLKTFSLSVRVPRVIRLLGYDKLPRQSVKFNRRNVFARDANQCQYCSKRLPTSELTLDHVVPRSQGGPTSWENLVCACVPCNTRKGGRTPKQARMALLQKPVRPKRNPLLQLTLGSPRYKSWKQFVSDAYWDVELKDE
ncbi:MAG: HNH endonuclease [Planctomycetota bacterium]|jgi:5-methylcytosine-specific restriction endonuclease McrA